MGTEVFKGPASVFRFLSESGYRAKGQKTSLSRAKVYADYRTGLFAVENPKAIKSEEILNYINLAGLVKVAPGVGSGRGLSELHREKAEAELENIRLKNEKAIFENELDRKLWLRREDVETQICIKLGVIDASIKAVVIDRAAAWISLAGGNPKKSEMIIELIHADIDAMFNELASFDELEVYIRTPGMKEDGDHELQKQTDN